MFPGAGAHIYRNEAGEPLGWDSGDDDGPYEPDDYLNDYDEPDDDDEGDADDDLPAISHDGSGGYTVTLAGHVTTHPTIGEAKAFLERATDDEGDDQPESHLPVDPATGRESTGADEIETDHEAPEPLEPDDAEVSWQEYGRAEAYSDVEQGRYDDDPSPYEGNYSEM
jgi:hypothetical protein